MRVFVGASMDGASAGMTVLTNHTAEGMDLFADVIEHPAFNNDDLERLRKQRLIGFQQEGDSVNAIAGRVGPKMVYGDHPYGAVGSGHGGQREGADSRTTSRASMRSTMGRRIRRWCWRAM